MRVSLIVFILFAIIFETVMTRPRAKHNRLGKETCEDSQEEESGCHCSCGIFVGGICHRFDGPCVDLGHINPAKVIVSHATGYDYLKEHHKGSY